MPAACRRALSQSGEGAIVTSWKTRAVKRGQRSSSSIAIAIQSAVRRSPSAGGSLSSSGVSSMPKSACTSRATPRIESRSARFEVTSSSITSCASGTPRGERLARLPAVAEHHDARRARPRCSSSRSDRIMPSEVSPRSLERVMRAAVEQHRAGQRHRDRVAGAEVPGAAHDLARLALPHVDARELQAVGVRVLAGLEHVARRRSAPRRRRRRAGRAARRPRPCRRRARAARTARRAAGARRGGRPATAAGTFIARLRGTARGSARRCRRSS